MKKPILVILMAIMIATPCLAQEIEPEGIFSIEGTLWSITSIGVSILLPFVGIVNSNLGFYQGEAYRYSTDGYASRMGESFYIDYPVVSIAFFSYGSCGERYVLALMQPSGFGVITSIGVYGGYGYGCSAYAEYTIGVMTKIQDDWTPPEVE